MAIRNNFSNAWEAVPVTIANGTSLSAAVDLGGLRLFAVSMPSAWTAANLTFQISPDGGATWTNLYDQSGSEIAATAAASNCVVLTPAQFASAQYIRVRSGSAASPVNQTADRTVQLILRSV